MPEENGPAADANTQAPDGPSSAPVGPAAPAPPNAPAAGEAAPSPEAFPARKVRKPRPHPYASEVSPPEELRLKPARVAALWFAVATLMTLTGMVLDRHFNPDPAFCAAEGAGTASCAQWLHWTLVPLFGGLGLLAFGISRNPKAKRFTMAGWLLFAFYWGLTAYDLYLSEGKDIVNFIFAVLGVYFFAYLAYHQWLSQVRRVDNAALHFLNVSTFVAAGSYFLIDKIEAVRAFLIAQVSAHTFWMLDRFGQGHDKGLKFVSTGGAGLGLDTSSAPTKFYYPDTVFHCPDGTDMTYASDEQFRATCQEHAGNFIHSFWDQVRHFAPDHDHRIIPVEIILACTALQSVMLFVGLFVGTQASWKAKLWTSVWVSAVIYILNLVRNTGIVWFYGQGHSSFWMMHNAIGKGGSLLAFVAIAFAVFKTFPAFFDSLVGVLDLPDRDGPIERALKFGRRRPATSVV